MWSELAATWANRCFGDPVYLPHELSYEPHTVVFSQGGESLLIGSKCGSVHELRGLGDDFDPELVCLRPGAPRLGATKTLDGSATPEDPAFVGTAGGHLSCLVGADTAWTLELDERIAVVRVIRRRNRANRVLVVDESATATLWRIGKLEPQRVASLSLPWFPRWAAREKFDRLGSFLVIARDGRTGVLRVENDGLQFEPRAALPGLPGSVAFSSPRAGQGPDLLYAHEHGITSATPFGDAEWAVYQIHAGSGFELLTQADIFGDHVVIGRCGSGRIETIAQLAQRSSRDAWRYWGVPWPELESEPVTLSVVERPAPNARRYAIALLRDHRIAQIAIEDRNGVRERLKRRRQWTGETDSERFAQLTIAPASVSPAQAEEFSHRGGDRTVDGLLHWLDRPAAAIDVETVVRLGAQVLIAASRIGRTRLADVAGRLTAILARLSRAVEGADFSRLDRFRRFVSKYFLHASYFERRQRDIESLVRVNEGKRNADALIHYARKVRRRFDLVDERQLAGGVWAMATRTEADGERTLAVAAGNGDVWAARLRPDMREIDATRLVRGVPVPATGALPSAPYSRFLVFGPEGRLLAAPRYRAHQDVVRSQGITFVALESDDPHRDRGQYYSAHLLASDRVVVGTRDADTPFVRFDLRAEPPERDRIRIRVADLPTPRRLIPRQVNRVWAIVELAPGWLAVGFEDGALRVLDSTNWSIHGGGYARSLRAPVRVLSVIHSADGRTLLAAGTEAGSVVVFEVRSDVSPPELLVKFREELGAQIVAILSDEDVGRPARLMLAIDASGRIAPFDLCGEATFLGRRRRRFRVSQTATSAVWAGDDQLVIGDWDYRSRRGSLRLVRFVRQDGLVRVRVVAWEMAHLSARELVPDRQGAADLLRAIPLEDASLRALISCLQVLAADLNDLPALVARLCRDSLRVCPNDYEEIKFIFDSVMERLESEPSRTRAEQLLERLARVLISPEGRLLIGGRDEPKLEAALMRRLLTSTTLRLWRRSRLSENLLVRWVQGYLQAPSEMLCLETARALSEALGGLVRVARDEPTVIDDVFGPVPEVDRAPRGAWIAHALSAYLHGVSGESRGLDAEIEPLGWAATSVLSNLFRLLPEATLSLLDLLAARGLDGSVVKLIEGRLTGRNDSDLARKIDEFWPWAGMDPARSQLLERCSHPVDNESVGVPPGSHDHAYLTASAKHLKRFKDLLRVDSETDLRRLASTVGVPEQSARSFGCLPAVADWLVAAARTLRESGNDDADIEISAVARAVQSPHSELWRSAEALPGPWRTLAVGTLRHWRRILRLELVISRRKIGPYTLKQNFARSPTTFTLEGHSDRLLATVLGGSDYLCDQVFEAWTALRHASAVKGSSLIPVHDVVKDPPFPAIVIRLVVGQSLKKEWLKLLELSDDALVQHAKLLYEELLAQLAELHLVGLYHDDIVRRNIVRASAAPGAQQYYLVDFGRVGMKPVGAPANVEDGAMDSAAERYSARRLEWEQRQQADVRRVTNIVAHLIARQEQMNSLADREPVRPYVESLASRELAAWVSWLDTVRGDVDANAHAVSLLRISREGGAEVGPEPQKRQPLVFISYKRSSPDDINRVTHIRRQLEGELRLRCPGAEVFQDEHGMQTGDQIDDSLRNLVERADALIVLLSPGWLQSRWCRLELTHFIRTERDRGRRPRVLPLLWVRVDDVQENTLRAALKADLGDTDFDIMSVRHDDWTELRFTSADDREARRRLSQLAETIVGLMKPAGAGLRSMGR